MWYQSSIRKLKRRQSVSQLYSAGLEVAAGLAQMDPDPDSPEGKLLLVLTSALENYETSMDWFGEKNDQVT
jgi:hypothetical protein